MKSPVFTVTFAFFAVHLILATMLPLFDDEAYYALWARDLDWGYYDHPPLIAYLIRSGISIFGETTFGVRFFPTLCFAAATYLVGATTLRLTNSLENAVSASVLFNVSILVFALGSFATPDAPLVLFWVATVWAADRAVNGPRYFSSESATWWAVAGFLLGLCGLSKLSGVFLGFGLLGYLVFTRKGRDFLGTGLPYIATIAALLPLAPYLLWNWQSDWLGFERQFSRLQREPFEISNLVEYLLALTFLSTPLVVVFALRGVLLCRVDAIIIWTTAPLLLYFLNYSTHTQVQANWLVPVHGGVAIAAVMEIASLEHRTRWFNVTVIVGALLSMLCVMIALNPWAPIGTIDNPPNQMRGWNQTKTEIAKALVDTESVWIATSEYALTGMLSHQFPQIQVYSLVNLHRYRFRAAFPKDLCNKNALLVERVRNKTTVETSSKANWYFDTTDASMTTHRTQSGKQLMGYRLTPVANVTVAELGC